MLGQVQYINNHSWGSSGELLSPDYFRQSASQQGFRHHKRASSSSSTTSGGPPSPLDQTSSFPQIARSDTSDYPSPSHYDSGDMYAPQGQLSKSLPTPVDTPITNTFVPSEYQQSFALPAPEHNELNSATMKRLRSEGFPDDDAASHGFSGPYSASEMSHNSPATPHTNYEGDFDDGGAMMNAGESSLSAKKWMDMYSQFNDAAGYGGSAMQNMAMFPEGLYKPNVQSAPLSPSSQMMGKVPRQGPQYHRRMIMADRLQAAGQDHLRAQTQSPVTSSPRERSPFRQSSTYVEASRMPSTAQFNAALSLRGGVGTVPPQQQSAQTTDTPKTISPKDTVLEYHHDDDSNSPLFPPEQTATQPLVSNRRQSSNFSNPAFTPNSQYYSHAYSTPTGVPQQYPFISQQSRTGSSMKALADQTPEFPAPIARMESSISEHPQDPPSSSPTNVRRPQDTSSDAGTYTCTYHGCTLRFDTPAKLQRHKREAHRQASPPSGAGGIRNTQAGPHKCERINPTTGKPCNSIFSRPYDLTRHEDTIHNARKQKVRCHLCTEEKTFSRNDALTRHMRIVHPEVDWPGKNSKRRGG
ncbi:MAG: hypothetical protein Q9160_003269 [Pyrenula sp. 1 TL-2023]